MGSKPEELKVSKTSLLSGAIATTNGSTAGRVETDFPGVCDQAPKPSEMAVRRSREAERLTLVQEASALPGRHAANLGHRDASLVRCRAKHGKFVRRQRQDSLVVVAAAERHFHHRRIGGDCRADRIGKRHARDIDLGRNAGRAAQLGEIAGETVGHIDCRRSVLQNRMASALRGSGKR